MSLRTMASLFIFTTLVAACAAPSAPIESTQPPAIMTENPVIATPTLSLPTPYPEPEAATPVSDAGAYPAPVEPTPEAGTDFTSGYEPQAGDENLQRSQVFIDWANSKLEVIASQPTQAKAILVGNLPDPCHKLRVVVNPTDANNSVNVEAYSLVDPGEICTTVLKPFSAIIPLGTFNPGIYSVTVNGEKLGDFNAAIAPQPGDDMLTRGEASVDMESSDLIYTAEAPLEVSVSLNGYLSDPCHQLRIIHTPADGQNQIQLDVYSVFDSGVACITVIEPFSVIYPLGSFTSGHYSVYVNGSLLGEFDG